MGNSARQSHISFNSFPPRHSPGHRTLDRLGPGSSLTAAASARLLDTINSAANTATRFYVDIYAWRGTFSGYYTRGGAYRSTDLADCTIADAARNFSNSDGLPGLFLALRQLRALLGVHHHGGGFPAQLRHSPTAYPGRFPRYRYNYWRHSGFTCICTLADLGAFTAIGQSGEPP